MKIRIQATPALALLSLAVLSGCAAVGPSPSSEVVAPERAPAEWRAPTANAARAAGPWWASLADATLSDLVGAAMERSPSLEAASARIAAARRWLARVLDS